MTYRIPIADLTGELIDELPSMGLYVHREDLGSQDLLQITADVTGSWAPTASRHRFARMSKIREKPLSNRLPICLVSPVRLP